MARGKAVQAVSSRVTTTPMHYTPLILQRWNIHDLNGLVERDIVVFITAAEEMLSPSQPQPIDTSIFF
jgi:hypothetical protein